MNIQAAGISDVGRVREENEDDFLIRSDLGLFTVADGVGGAAAGEVASHIFIKTSENTFKRPRSWNTHLKDIILNSFSNANSHIAKYGINTPSSAGMGCTAEILGFEDGKYLVGHVGDSRTYLFRDGTLRQITKDHSVNQERIDLGLVDKNAPSTGNNAIYLAVGHMDNTPASMYSDNSRPGDIFLLCSDGLTDMLPDKHIEDILRRYTDLPHALKLLINEANRKGGKDNITVLLVKVED